MVAWMSLALRSAMMASPLRMLQRMTSTDSEMRRCCDVRMLWFHSFITTSNTSRWIMMRNVGGVNGCCGDVFASRE